MNPDRQLYFQDAYLKEFDSEAVSCGKRDGIYAVILKESAFYPEGGGQPGDHGTLNGIEVFDTKEENGETVHLLREEILPGTPVHGVIDWKRRFDHMQNHTGEHIFSGILHQMYGVENVGFHMGEMIQVDFDGYLNEEQIAAAEEQANRIIWSNVPVKAMYPYEEELKEMTFRSKKELHGLVRIVTIPDADICACCGTHLKRTGEVGMIHVVNSMKHKKGVRINILSGERAYRHIAAVTKQNHLVSAALSAPLQETAEAVERMKGELAQARAKTVEKMAEIFSMRMKDLPDHEPLLVVFAQDLDRLTMRKFANDLIEKKNAGTAAVLCGEDSTYTYVIISHEQNLKERAKALHERLGGRGGGSAEMIQGTFAETEEKIRQGLDDILLH